MNGISEGPRGSVLTPQGWVRGRVRIEAGRISSVDGEPVEGEPAAPFVLPGFVDLHVHGGGGADTMDGEAAVRQLAQFHASHGTAALAPTTITAPVEEIAAALRGVAAVRQAPESGEALVLGAHLEGPFLNPGKLGAQPPFAIPPDSALAQAWCDLCPLAVATVAPEMPGAFDLARVLAARGCRVQIGHTLADAGTAVRAFEGDFAGATHLFNAMSGFDHREPGVAAACFAAADHAEIIADLQHVDATVIRAAARAIPYLHAVTDSTEAAGKPDGEYKLGRYRVFKQGNRVLLEDGRTLAGSVLTMDQALRNLVSIGLTLEEASRMTSTRAARYLGRDDLGRVERGARASLVVLDENLEVAAVWLDGRPVHGG